MSIRRTLTTVALGLHRYFHARGESPRRYKGFRALVPARLFISGGCSLLKRK